ncbi:MAG: DNA-methyltransferase, partial [Promethearchaeota archaeon]
LPLPFHFFNLLSELFVWNETIIWDKTHVINFKAYSSRRALSYLNAPISFNYHPNWSHEFIFIFQKKGKTNSNFEKDPHFNGEEFIKNYSRSIWQIEPIPPTLCRTHPARFPFEIPQHLIKYYSNKGDTIFDPFAGYGTVLIEALRLGRIGVGNDIELEFCEIMNRNVEKLERDPDFFRKEVQLHRIKTYVIEYRKKNLSDQTIFSLLCKMKYEQDLIKLALTTYI